MMANAHAYAIQIEMILRRVFHCDRSGMAGIIDADFIEGNQASCLLSSYPLTCSYE